MKKPKDAEWSDKKCPKCDSTFVAVDRYGYFCCAWNCNWKEYLYEKKVEDENVPYMDL